MLILKISKILNNLILSLKVNRYILIQSRGGCLCRKRVGDGEKAVRGRREGELGKISEGFMCYKTAPYFLLLDKIGLNLVIKKCHMKGVQSGLCITALILYVYNGYFIKFNFFF